MKGQTSLVDQFGFTCTPPKRSAHTQEALLDATLGSNDGMSPDEQVSITVVPKVGSPSSEIMLLIPDEQVSVESRNVWETWLNTLSAAMTEIHTHGKEWHRGIVFYQGKLCTIYRNT
jgi:hypothetical protein